MTTVLPAAAAAAGSLALDSVQHLGSRLSFAALFHRDEAAASPQAEAASSDESLTEMLDDVVAKLKRLGLDLTSPSQLSIGNDGHIQVDSDAANRHEVEEAIAGDMDLTGKIQHLFASVWKGRQSNLAELGLTATHEELSDLRLTLQGNSTTWRVD